MQHGASVSTGQLIKILTRGKTDRISADPLLEFFRPLESWLEQQNRNEPVIGWNSDMNDVSLFEASTNECEYLHVSKSISLITLVCVLYF